MDESVTQIFEIISTARMEKPTVDPSVCLVDLDDSEDSILSALNQSLTTLGFVYIRDKKRFPPSRNKMAMQWLKQFFSLPLSVRSRDLMPLPKCIRGLFATEITEGLVSYESDNLNASIVDFKEGWEASPPEGINIDRFSDTVVGRLFSDASHNRWPVDENYTGDGSQRDWDCDTCSKSVKDGEHLHAQPNLSFSSKLFRDFVTDWYRDCLHLGAEIVHYIDLSLQKYQNKTFDLTSFCTAKNAISSLRLLHYPPPSEHTQQVSLTTQGEIIGIGAHRDYGFLTLLMQDNSGGLQIAGSMEYRSENDNSCVNPEHEYWIDIEPNDKYDLFVVNVGDMMMQMTKQIMKSNIHRVLRKSNTNESRISIPFFLEPQPHTPISDNMKCEDYLLQYYHQSGIVTKEILKHHSYTPSPNQ